MNLVRYTLLEVVLGGSILSVAWAQAPETRPEPARPARGPDAPGAARPFDDAPRSAAPIATPAPDAPTAVRPPDHAPRQTWDGSPRAMRRRGPAAGMPGMGGFGGPFGRGRAMAFPHRMSEEEMQDMEALDQALSKLKAGKNDAEKESAKKDLSQALDKLFQR